MPAYSPLEQRFWNKVEKTESCWNWTASRDSNGYGQINGGKDRNGRHYNAHHVAWELCFGQIPKGMEICHKCDNRSCVNPTHLFLGNRSDNMQDASKKGRMKNTFSQGNIPWNKDSGTWNGPPDSQFRWTHEEYERRHGNRRC